MGQVINFHTCSRIPADRFAAALNSRLPRYPCAGIKRRKAAVQRQILCKEQDLLLSHTEPSCALSYLAELRLLGGGHA